MTLTYDKVLVTGGTGVHRKPYSRRTSEKGSQVWVLDSLSTGTLRNLRRWRGNPKFHFKKNSVTQSKVVDSLAGKVDAVVHLAAIVSPYLSIKKPQIVNDVNVSGTLNVLRAAVKRKVERIVFASSSSVYGSQTILPISESNPLEPITPYGVSKLAAEKYCGAFHQTYGLSTVSVRYFNVYGQRQKREPIQRNNHDLHRPTLARAASQRSTATANRHTTSSTYRMPSKPTFERLKQNEGLDKLSM